ncbi:MAG TPA: S9 family peptidase, partial [Verrucomicrobiae bacterium]
MRLLLLFALLFAASTRGAETNEVAKQLDGLGEALGHTQTLLARQLNELIWFQRLSDVAFVDKVRFTGPPPRTTNNPTPPSGSNEVIVSALTFLPRDVSRSKRLPLIVLAHGEIHGNVASDEDANVVRELIQQGYAVIAPDYRGSSGYGGDFY